MEIRPLRAEDGSAIHRSLLGDPVIAAWFRTGGPFTLEECEEMVTRKVAHRIVHRFGWSLAWEGDTCIGWGVAQFCIVDGFSEVEVGWTVAASAILIGLAVLTFAKLSSIENPPNSSAEGEKLAGSPGVLYASSERKLPPDGKSLNIQVVGRQYIWQFVYPGASESDGLGAPYSYEQMVVPTNTTVTLDIVASDVVHSWWIPELGGKFQAVPGYHSYTWFKATKPGLYRGQCAILCGRGHARMIATVKAVPPAQFEAWLAYQKKQISEANAQAKLARAKLNAQTGAGQVENP